LDWRLGGSTWGLFTEQDPAGWISRAEAVRRIVALGLGVELWPTRSLQDPDMMESEVACVRELCTAAPFAVVHTRGRYWSWNPSNLRTEVELTASLGATTLVLHPVCLGLDERDDRFNVREVAEIARFAADRGVRLALENLRNSIWALDRALDGLGDNPQRTNLGICIDVGHARISTDAGPEPVGGYLERYARQLVHLHLHDTRGTEDDHLVPGRGCIDWRRLLRSLQTLTFSGTAVLETYQQGIAPIEAIERGRTFLESVKLTRAGRAPG
jgi:sugar phosphate isomerase/epimerase